MSRGIFQTQGSNLPLLCLLHWQGRVLYHLGSPHPPDPALLQSCGEMSCVEPCPDCVTSGLRNSQPLPRGSQPLVLDPWCPLVRAFKCTGGSSHPPRTTLDPQDASWRRNIPLPRLGRTALLSRPSAACSPRPPLPQHSRAPLAQFPLLPSFVVPGPSSLVPWKLYRISHLGKKVSTQTLLCRGSQARTTLLQRRCK